MKRAPQPDRPITARLRMHLGSKANCPCVRCEAADEISRLRVELWEAYEQIAVLLVGYRRTTSENDLSTWAEISDNLSEQMRNSHPPAD